MSMAQKLTLNEFLIMEFLEREGSGTAFDVAPAAVLTSNTSRKILQRLSGHGWVVKTADPASQRRPYVLSEAGKKVLRESAQARQRQKWLISESSRLALNAGLAILARLDGGTATVEALVEAVAFDKKSVVAVLRQLERAEFVSLESGELSSRTVVSVTALGELYEMLHRQHRDALEE